jgi:hypothetical protein
MMAEDKNARWRGETFKALLLDLREIGWSEWDPIGLSRDRLHCEDEYDSYLLAASGKLSSGIPMDRVVAYLVGIESVHMGMPGSATAHSRATRTARRIADFLGY